MQSFAERVGSWKQITDSWLEIFNYGTLPFYWGTYEPEEGKPDRDTRSVKH